MSKSTLSNSTHHNGYRPRILNTPAHNICNHRRWAKHDFSTTVKSKYRGQQIQEDIFGFLLIIWSQVLTIVFVF